MPRLRLLSLGAALILTSACYHATIETGATPSSTVIRKGFASGWIYGLVPPSTVETASQCPNGVARVETKLSFVNQLVQFLTLGIYAPMEIVVTCAASGSADSDSGGHAGVVEVDRDSPTGFEDALAAAIGKSLSEKAPILIRL